MTPQSATVSAPPVGAVLGKSNVLARLLREAQSMRRVYLGGLGGSSREYFTVQLAGSGANLILLLRDDKLLDRVGQNCLAYLSLLGLKVPVIPYHLAGIGTERVDPYYVNDKFRAMHLVRGKGPGLVIASVSGFREALACRVDSQLALSLNQTMDRESLIRTLVAWGYERVRYLERPFEFAVRGGILDIYGAGMEWPVRMEFHHNRIDLMRTLDPASQRTTAPVPSYTVHDARTAEGNPQTLAAWMGTDWRLLDYDGDADVPEVLDAEGSLILSEHPFPGGAAGEGERVLNVSLEPLHLPTTDGHRRVEDLFDWLRDPARTIRDIYFSCSTPGEVHRLQSVVATECPGILPVPQVFQSDLVQGFLCAEENFALITDDEIYNRYQSRSKGFRYNKGAYSLPLQEYAPGDFVVHSTHGVGRFQGIQEAVVEGLPAEVMVIEYADGARLFVPREHYYLVEKYVGNNQAPPVLDHLGTTRWSRKKAEATLAIQDYAAKILKIEAEREMKEGRVFPVDAPLVHDFELSFHFQETPDQEAAIQAVKRDLASAKPMHRLVLGDVGFGKTEVAARAAMITATSGAQTAMLVPTTILAEQHFQTFKERMADYPVRIEVLSRFTSGREERRILEELRSGRVDIIIGTHRLVQKDVLFKDLGLLIIDEEQRFGVAHKDYLVRRYPLVNILMLSATPIPRTLYLSLMGARDMSAIATPPRERRPIETFVIAEDFHRVRGVIDAELERGGQVFFVHNRVESIRGILERLDTLVPGARFAVAHGQLSEKELKGVMERFQAGKIDCLIATSIIESGLDLPNVNTLLVHRADQFGLADLYQLRGRVGRYNRQAYAYFMMTPGRILDGQVRKRVHAIHEFTKPGGGYRVALKDLEIRGAGNILGTSQSGHIAAIGFDLYCKLLKDAIKALKGEPITPSYEVQLYIGDAGSIPSSYIPDFSDRFQYYKRLASVEEQREIDLLESEIRDKFGRPPAPMKVMIQVFRLKCACRQRQIVKIEVRRAMVEVIQRGRKPRDLRLPDLRHVSLVDWLLETIEDEFARPLPPPGVAPFSG